MKKNKILSLCMAAIMAVSVIPMTAFASSSVGSTSADTTVGEDTAPILVNEDIETTLNEIEQANKEKNEEIER